jgi:hypothetical protein
MAELFLGGKVDPATHDRTGDDIRIGADDFTTHGVIVGMTGSGKTGLGIVLVEEVLGTGHPALVIDPKGDLTNLCLLFPNLQPADFRPWVDERQASTESLTPDAFAAQQADAWSKGLAGWGLSGADITTLRSAVDFTIYTPGSRSGVPVNIVGSLQAPADMSDAELVGDEIEGYVSGLLGLVGIAADPLTSREHILLSNLIANAWSEGRSLDLPTLVGMIGNPPIRKLGVFELDQFFPQDARMELAMKLNGLLASPSFAAWADGPALDIGSMLYTAEGKARCAIVTTAHLSDEERQFVTALVLSKLVTWMRRQSGTSELRALLYMDEVTGYLPPTANPPTKKPIMTLMKQARAFGLGVVLATQNPVDVDYKALSNAGTWMIGRLQTERDKQRLTDGLSSASGGIDVAAVAATISGLAKREFVLRRAGKDTTEVFTTRWAMSYLRGPMTRDQIAAVMAGHDAATAQAGATATAAAATPSAPAANAPTTDLAQDETTVMPQVAAGVPVRWIDVAAPWLASAGGDTAGTRLEPVVVARVRLRYDDTKAGLTHDEEYECVLTELTDPPDPARATAVDYDDRDLRAEPQSAVVYRITSAPLTSKAYFGSIERGLRDHLAGSLTIELAANIDLKLYGRPGESPADFAARCDAAADERAAADIAKLRDKYEAKATRIRDSIAGAEDRVDVLQAEAEGKRNDELLSTAGSILGDLLGGRARSRTLRSLGTAAGRRGRTNAAHQRVEAAQGKVGRLQDDLNELEAELASELAEIDAKWQAVAERTSTLTVGLERTDVQVAGVVLAWMPVA